MEIDSSFGAPDVLSDHCLKTAAQTALRDHDALSRLGD
jgi:hypothetical protein